MLLDATYKTMIYELPLLFVVVKTNVYYTCSVFSVMVGIIQLVWAFRTGCSIATGDGSVTPAVKRRVKDIIFISAMMKSCYFATTLTLTPQNSMAIEIQQHIRLNTLLLCYSFLRWPWITNNPCDHLLGVSLGLNFLFTLRKIIWKIMKWNYKHLVHGK